VIGLTKKRWIAMSALSVSDPKRLPGYMKKHGIKLGPKGKGHLKVLSALTKKALAKQMVKAGVKGEDLEGDDVGIFKTLGKVAATVALPAAALAYGVYKGGKWVGKKIFGKKPTAAQRRRTARLRHEQAAMKRRIAAEARTQAAEAETDEARKSAEAAATAAEAEAAADDAEAEAQEAQASMEAGITPGGEAETEAEGDAMLEGEFNPQFPDQSPDHFAGEFIGEFVGDWVDMIGDARTKKIVQAAASKTPLGAKVRAGAKVYQAAKRGSPAAKTAIAKMAAKAKAGDPQAKRDLAAVKAGRVAITAKPRVLAGLALKKRAAAVTARVKAIRTKTEKTMAKPLIAASRRAALRKASKVEARAAKGDPKAKAIVAKVVSRAKAKDPKAQAAVKAMQLARAVRKAAPTATERRNLRQARRLATAVRKGNPKAKKQLEILQAAAKAGNPRAKRAADRIRLGDAINQTLATGKVSPKPGKRDPRYHPVRKPLPPAKLRKIVAKVKAGRATREEALAAAKEANAAGNFEAAATLAEAASKLPSATAPLKSAAAVAAAAQLGNPAAQATIKETLDRARAGDPAGINGAGQLAAVQGLDAIKNGEPMSRPVAEATALVARADAGDPEAKRIVERVQTGITAGDPKAIEAGVALVAAASIAKATAANPAAAEQWNERASESLGTKIPKKQRKAAGKRLAGISAKVQAGTATQDEADEAIRLATALGKPSIAAAISARKPNLEDALHPMSIPDAALPPVTSFWGAVKEGFRALMFATPDPLQNYREGLRSREKEAPLLPPTKKA
jgi:hypothetical protein